MTSGGLVAIGRAGRNGFSGSLAVAPCTSSYCYLFPALFNSVLIPSIGRRQSISQGPIFFNEVPRLCHATAQAKRLALSSHIGKRNMNYAIWSGKIKGTLRTTTKQSY